MGDLNVSDKADEQQLRSFTRAILNDLQTLERMLSGDYFEENVRRIGAEQEMFLVDSAMQPKPLALDIIEKSNDDRLTTELGLFNLEANVKPLDFTGDCLSRMETELNDVLDSVRRTARSLDADIVLVGTLPTLQQSDFVEENLTPLPRYKEMNRVLTEMHGDRRTIQIRGLDELQLTLENTFIEFSNTSFQIHLQVGISEFVRHYNWAQAIAAPVLAAAVNSPLLLGKRLWHETRLALFQHATDTRSPVHQERDQPPRVNFGDQWVADSMLEVFREDVARFRVILSREIEEDSLAALENGVIPELAAWQLHNGTIWRWNRACYGIRNDKASLRIEARFLPAGPTVADEMANAAFFLGLMTALPARFGDVREQMDFDDAKRNFFNAAQNGLNTQFVWFGGKNYSAKQLILEELLPLARTGLETAGIAAADAEKFLGIIEERVRGERTGAEWMLDSLAQMDEKENLSARMKKLTSAIKENQETGAPVHTWKIAEAADKADSLAIFRTIEQIMSTDLYTVRPEDVIELAASLMNWKNIRHVPVEDDQGRLIGIISYHDLLELFATDKLKNGAELVVRDLMNTDLTVAAPETAALEALQLMREKQIGCLPIVKNEKLVGIITTDDFLNLSTRLLEERLQAEQRAKASSGQ